MIKKNYILYIIIILSLLTSASNAKNYESKTYYFIAKKLAFLKDFDKSDFILKQIIKENDKNNKYVKKSKILRILIQYKKKDIDNAKKQILALPKNYHKNENHDAILYLKALIYLNLNDNLLQNIFKIKKYSHEQTMQHKSIKILKNLTAPKKYEKKIKENIIKIKKEITLHKIYLANFYIKKKAYIATINRLINNNKKLRLKKSTDYYITYLILKCYNELLLDKISNNILTYLKNNDKIKNSSILLHH